MGNAASRSGKMVGKEEDGPLGSSVPVRAVAANTFRSHPQIMIASNPFNSAIYAESRPHADIGRLPEKAASEVRFRP